MLDIEIDLKDGKKWKRLGLQIEIKHRLKMIGMNIDKVTKRPHNIDKSYALIAYCTQELRSVQRLLNRLKEIK